MANTYVEQQKIMLELFLKIIGNWRPEECFAITGINYILKYLNKQLF